MTTETPSPVAPAEPAVDSLPMVSLDRFQTETGMSSVTTWRYRKKGWLSPINIGGRLYLSRTNIEEFNRRAARGEFAVERGCAKKKAA